MSEWIIIKKNPDDLISLDWTEYCSQYRSDKPAMVIVDFPEVRMSSVSCLSPFGSAFPDYMDFGRSALVAWDQYYRLKGSKYKRIISRLSKNYGIDKNSFAVESMGLSNSGVNKFVYGDPDPYNWILEHRSALVPVEVRDELVEYLHLWLVEMGGNPFCYAPDGLSIRNWVVSYKKPECISDKTGMAVWRDAYSVMLFCVPELFSEENGYIRSRAASIETLKTIVCQVRDSLSQEKKVLSGSDEKSTLPFGREFDLIGGHIASGSDIFPGIFEKMINYIATDSDKMDDVFRRLIYEVCILRSEIIRLSGSLGFWNGASHFVDMVRSDQFCWVEQIDTSREMAESKEYRDAMAAIQRNCESYRDTMFQKYKFLSSNPIDRGFMDYLS